MSAGQNNEIVCNEECAAVLIDDEAGNAARFDADEIVGSNMNARVER